MILAFRDIRARAPRYWIVEPHSEDPVAEILEREGLREGVRSSLVLEKAGYWDSDDTAYWEEV